MDNLAIIRRTDVTLPMVLTDEEGAPYPITGFTFWFTVKRRKTDADSKALIGPKKVTVHDNPANGETHVTLTPEDTNIPEGLYWYDFQMKDGDNLIAKTPATVIEVGQDITVGTT